MNNNIKKQECQVEKEIKKRFLPRKQESLLLSESYARIGCDYFNNSLEVEGNAYIKRAERVSECGTFLEWGRTINDEYKLHNANFCRDRLCPMCSFRRSYKIFSQVSSVMDVIENDYNFLFLTLTVPNVYGWELSKKIDKMNNAFTHKLRRHPLFKKVVKGYFRALEITHDNEPNITAKMYNKKKEYYNRQCLSVGDVNPNYNKFHPHFHCILAVNKSYFQKSYIKHDEWLQMWRDAMDDQTITQVDIRKCKPKGEKLTKSELQTYKSLSSAVSEVAKYSVKSDSYIIKNNEELTDETVKHLSKILAGRRLCSMGGIFKSTYAQIKKDLKLDDMEDGDLIHVEAKLRTDIFIQIYRYEWTAGAYKLTEVTELQ